MRFRVLLPLALLALVIVPIAPAASDVPTSFTACVSPNLTGPPCFCAASLDDAYLAGSTLYLRGKVTPPHASLRAGVWRKAPGSTVWTKVTTVDIWATGGMRWKWVTSGDEANPKPWRYQLRIWKHGTSNVCKAYVIISGT